MVDLNLTVPDLFLRAVNARKMESALWIKRSGDFVRLSWQEVATEVSRTVAMLKGLGVNAGDRVAAISENRFEWVLLDLACHFTGAIYVPLHASLTGPQWSEQILHSGARHVFVSTNENLTKLSSVIARLPPNIVLTAFDEVTTPLPYPVHSWQEQLHAAQPVDLAKYHRRPEDVATILYTSGTTGHPKGVMLSQQNLSSNAQAVVEMYGDVERELKLNILPLSHIYARTCDLYCWIARGSELALAQSRESVLEDLQLVRPTTMNAVPYFYDRLRRALCEKGLNRTPGALLQLLGGRVRSCSSGGAPLPRAVTEFYVSQDIPLLEGYGLTEASPVITHSTRNQTRIGSCGKPPRGVELKIDGDGEVLTRGPHVMLGYYQDPGATAAVIDDGWLHTGDLGRVDDEGFLYIVGRKKEMIVTSTGKKISPTAVESLLMHEPLIAQAMVIGEGRSHLVALIVPQPDALRALIIAQQIGVRSSEEALASPTVHALYQERINLALAELSSSEQVRKFVLLPRAFSIEDGEMTQKLSLRREVIATHFADQIEGMYARPIDPCGV